MKRRQLAIVNTDQMGRFTFADTRQLWEESEWNVTATLLVTADGYGMDWYRVPQNGTPLDITLPQATSLRVSFTDEQQQPIVGLPVTIWCILKVDHPYKLFFFPSALHRQYCRITDNQGDAYSIIFRKACELSCKIG